MKNKVPHGIRFASIGILALAAVGIAGSVGAVESEYNATWCGTAKNTVLESGPDMMLFSQESWGIMTPTSKANDPFQDATTHCVGYVRILYGKTTAMGSCRWTDNTGDTFVGSSRMSPASLTCGHFLLARASGREYTEAALGGSSAPVSPPKVIHHKFALRFLASTSCRRKRSNSSRTTSSRLAPRSECASS